MSLPVSPDLFDVLIQYAKGIEQGKVKPTPSLGATSPALTFCENFYAQLFQNRFGQPIEHINTASKKAAVRLRLDINVLYVTLLVCALVSGALVLISKNNPAKKFECTPVAGAPNVYVCKPK